MQVENMEPDILKKEDEFYKENELLEMKTKELMKKVDDVMRIQDSLMAETYKTKLELNKAKKKSAINTKTPEKSIELNLEELNIPKSVDEMGEKGSSQFYKAKVHAMHNDITRLQRELKNKSEEIRRLTNDNKQLKEDKVKLFASSANGKNKIDKLESQITTLNSKIHSKDADIQSLRKENETLRRDLKHTNSMISSLDVKLTRAVEENEKLKVEFKTLKDNERDLKEAHRKQVSELEKAVKEIDAHRTELFNGFKKQILLIDNLKKQKMHLEALKAAVVSEEQYMKLLDWNIET